MWQFQPIYKSTIWGGMKIAALKDVTIADTNIGESWEISGVEGDESIVAAGPDKGCSLPQLIRRHGASLMGRRNFERFALKFPLLIKIIDAQTDLSVQVHPDDALAVQRGDTNGKTEMWYVLDAEPGTELTAGFSHTFPKDAFAPSASDGSIIDSLMRHAIKPGDAIFIPAGRVHAIGGGSLIIEVQQTSNVTYRIFDYMRRDASGNMRELHVDLAKDAIDFSDTNASLIHPDADAAPVVPLIECQQFTTRIITAATPMHLQAPGDSFRVYIAIEGSAAFSSAGQSILLKRGESVLVAADEKNLLIEPCGRFRALEAMVIS